MSSFTDLLYNGYNILICFIFRGRMEMQNHEKTLVPFSSQFLMNKAARIMIQARSKPSSQEMQMLIPRGSINPWRASGDLEKSILISSYCGYCPVMGKGCDTQFVKIIQGAFYNISLNSTVNNRCFHRRFRGQATVH